MLYVELSVVVVAELGVVIELCVVVEAVVGVALQGAVVGLRVAVALGKNSSCDDGGCGSGKQR